MRDDNPPDDPGARDVSEGPDATADAIASARPRLPGLDGNFAARLARATRAKAVEASGTIDSPSPKNSKKIGRYSVLEVLGRGAMGEVLAAHDPELGRRVALKLLHSGSDDDAPRLRREAQVLARLSHPNVVQVFEVGQHRGRVFVAMEIVEGQTLQAWQKQQPAPGWADCVRAYLGAGRGLAAAHAEGLVHRDFKPGNCMIDERSQVKVLDFGLARRIDAIAPEPEPEPEPEPSKANTNTNADATNAEILTTLQEQLDEDLSRSLTRTGTIVGTMAYMAPETMRGGLNDTSSDQFGFCVALYEAVYGERPFAGETMRQLVGSVLRGEVRPPPARASVPARLRRVLLRGLEVEPARRYPSMDALLVALERLVAPRSWRWIALGASGLGLGLAALGLGLGRYAEVGQRCEGAEQELVGAWDDERRGEVEAALLGSSRSYASGTWARVEQGLDAYAESWRQDYVEICEATRVRQVQTEEAMELRMRCLGGRRRELSAVVNVLARADETTVAKAVELVAGLPAPSWCRGPEVLEEDVPPPENPEIAAQVEAQRAQLAEAAAGIRAGGQGQIEALLEQIVERGEALGYEPLLAEALAARGVYRLSATRYDEAESDMHRAFELALEHDHARVQLKVALEFVRLHGLIRPDPKPGQRWGRWALAMAERENAEPLDLPRALTRVGLMLREQEQMDAAMEHFERSLSMLPQHEGAMGLAAAEALENISIVQRWRRQFDASIDNLERAQQIRERIQGREHPTYALGLVTLGNAYQIQGRPAEALEYFERALGLLTPDMGDRHITVGLTMLNASTSLQDLGALEQSLAWGLWSLDIVQDKLGPDAAVVGKGMTNVGNTLKRLGQLDKSVQYHRKAAEILLAAQGERSIAAGQVLGNFGSSLVEIGELAEGVEQLRRSVSILEESSLGPNNGELLTPLVGLAGGLRLMGSLDEAEQMARRALAIAEQQSAANSPDRAEPLLELAELALARNAPEHARSSVDRALDLTLDKVSHGSILAQLRFAQARALWSLPERRAEAIDLAHRARESFIAQGKQRQGERVDVETWLETRAEP